MKEPEPPRRDLGALWIALAACGLYLWFGQRRPYGDAIGILVLIENGAALQNSKHFLYAPLVDGLARLFADHGLSPYRAGLVLSAVGAGLGVWLSYAASRCYGMPRRAAMYVAALVATCPAVMFFATTFEYHALYFGFAMAALLCLTRLLDPLVVRPAIGRAALCGLATGTAWFAHESGDLLPWWAALFLLLHARERGYPLARAGRAALVVLLSHHALTHGLSALLRHFELGAVGPGSGAASMVTHWQEYPRPLSTFLSVTTVWEWLVPFLPLSVLALLGTLAGRGKPGRRDRPRTPEVGPALGLTLHAGVLAYLLVTFVIVVLEDEFGAYLLPLAWPAACLTVRLLPAAGVLAAIAIGLAVGATKITSTDAPRASLQRAAALQHVVGDRPITFLVADRGDAGWSFVEFPRARRFHFDRIAFLSAPQVEAAFGGLAAGIEGQLDAGSLAFLPRASRELLALPEARAFSSGVAAFERELLARFELLPVGSVDEGEDAPPRPLGYELRKKR